jgi:hypothetical protein
MEQLEPGRRSQSCSEDHAQRSLQRELQRLLEEHKPGRAELDQSLFFGR